MRKKSDILCRPSCRFFGGGVKDRYDSSYLESEDRNMN